MSIQFIKAGDMLADPAELHVIAVNAVAGVMGAGQAKAYAERFHGLKDCHRVGVDCGMIRPGRGHLVWITNAEINRPDPFGVYLLATKDHWRDPSRLEWVAGGLDALVEVLGMVGSEHYDRRVRSVALPSLGCGLGNLRFADVRPLIEAAAAKLPGIDWRCYMPGAERNKP